MTSPTAPERYDVFLSHGSPDKPWVETLRAALERRGLRAFLDKVELKTGGNWTTALRAATRHSRALALVLSKHTLARDWVHHEWTAYLAEHGPRSGRLVPVLLDPVELPPFLKPLQA